MNPVPIRVRRSRSRGWRKPPWTVNVARPGRFGNPFAEGKPAQGVPEPWLGVVARDKADAARLHREWIDACGLPPGCDLETLRGRNLMCWCPLDGPCHADYLLILANRPTDSSPPATPPETGRPRDTGTPENREARTPGKPDGRDTGEPGSPGSRMAGKSDGRKARRIGKPDGRKSGKPRSRMAGRPETTGRPENRDTGWPGTTGHRKSGLP
ncbi:MAG: DUF4326 domain-containing protein [Caulobacteraceae bacterium]|nr:DUF4326 domain-containing protein [Caulobacteraceae bacterium]